jgi:hypothetical protein
VTGAIGRRELSRFDQVSVIMVGAGAVTIAVWRTDEA